MLKKIPVSQLKLGMHVHGLEGRWIDHPFWKTRFMLDDPQDLASLRGCGVKECWIDVALGCDVQAEAASEPAPAAATPVQLDDAAPVAAPGSSRASLRDELDRAAAICRRSRHAVTSMFREARLGRAVSTEACLPLIQDITDSVFRNPGALVSLARLKTKDDYTYMHSVAVCALMVALGRQLGMSESLCRVAGLAGMLHDIGKALVPLDVLNKPGKLTPEEFDIVRAHPVHGRALLEEAGGAPQVAIDVCVHHHERIDGAGYPHRLAGDQITPMARMGAVCDVYDAVTSNRPYKAGWDPATSIAQMASWKGHFDPVMFSAFVKSLGIYPVGSLVRLESGRIAVVVDQNGDKLSQPIVKAFFSSKSEMPIPPLTIDLAAPGCNDRIAAREPTARWKPELITGLWCPPDVASATR